MNTKIFYHEDSFKQIELMPEENYFSVNKNISENELKEVSDNGCVIIHERVPVKINLESKKIPFENITNDLKSNCTTFFPIVETGYGNEKRIHQNSIAYSFGRLAIFIESNLNDSLKNMWIGLIEEKSTKDAEKKLMNVLNILGIKYNLILVDWDEEVAIRLSSKNIIKKYLQEIFNFNLDYLS